MTETNRPAIARHRVTTPAGHQTTYRGTLDQAEAWAELQGTHDTDPRHAVLTAVLRGEKHAA